MNKTITTEEACTHEPLVDTGVGYYHCPACNQGWSYQEWELKNSKPNLMNKSIEESSTSTNTQVTTVCAKELRGEAGCKELCDECKRKMQEDAVSTEAEGWTPMVTVNEIIDVLEKLIHNFHNIDADGEPTTPILDIVDTWSKARDLLSRLRQ